MYFRFRTDRPFISGKAALRSAASWSIIFAPQPFSVWRSNITVPISQYRCNSCVFTVMVARSRASLILDVRLCNISP